MNSAIFTDTAMKYKWAQWVESLPLTVFVLYIHSVTLVPGRDWLLPYLVASGLGAGVMLYGVRQNWLLNRLFVGVNLYFFSGLIALVLHWHLINHFYAQQGAAAMLGWILIVGLWMTIKAPIGILGVLENSARIGSWCLLGVCLVAILTAIWFKGSILFGEWLPFIVLFVACSFIASAVIKAAIRSELKP